MKLNEGKVSARGANSKCEYNISLPDDDPMHDANAHSRQAFHLLHEIDHKLYSGVVIGRDPRLFSLFVARSHFSCRKLAK